MPELSPMVLGFSALTLAAGFILGWILRGGRIRREKDAINVSWQDQMNAQKSEHDRLADQNTSLMQQISQYRASKKDSDLRAKELSESLKEAFERRDELQRQLKEMRNKLDVSAAKRDKLQADVDSGAVRHEASASALKEKDDKIFKLSRELESWQNRLPPLLERFRLRDREAQELEADLEKAETRIASLENLANSGETRIEPVETNPIADGMDASNDQFEETSEHDLSALGDDDDPQAEESGWRDAVHDAENEAADAAEDDSGTGLLDATDEADEEQPADAAEDQDGYDDDDDDGDVEAAGTEELHEDGGETDADVSDETPVPDRIGDVGPDDDGEHAEIVELAEHEQTSIDTYHAEGVVDFDLGDAEPATVEDNGGANNESWTDGPFDAGPPDGQDDGDDDDDDDNRSAADPDPQTDDGAGDTRANGAARGGHAESVDGRDNLQRIKGVGPAIEKTLNDLGIYRFNQIAEMSEYDIDRVARELRGFRSRIYREDWIGQARSLQFEKTNGSA